MNKILEVIEELEDEIQFMREEGETDLRTVLHHIRHTKSKIWAIIEEEK